MDGTIVADRISRGLGAAARHVGATFDAFRPSGTTLPLAPEGRFLRLQAAFNAQDRTFGQPQAYGHAVWWGVFDSAYTKPGDYLQGAAGTWFIAAQQALLPPLCVQTNCNVSVLRPAAPTTAGLSGYGGIQQASAASLLIAWPASILTAGSARGGELPSDVRTADWTVLLPVLPDVVALRGADLVIDDQGRTLVVISAEQSALGWRLVAKQSVP